MKFDKSSELLYLLEPHILKYAQEYYPNQLTQILTSYIKLKQGSLIFIKHMMSLIALQGNQIGFKAMMNLLEQIKNMKQLDSEIKIILDNNIIPQVDKLQPQDILVVAKAMKNLTDLKSVFYDLIAAEYARKIQPSLGQLPNSQLTFTNKVKIL